MFDKVFNYLFQNLTTNCKVSEDEERIVFTAGELKIEVSHQNHPLSKTAYRQIHLLDIGLAIGPILVLFVVM